MPKDMVIIFLFAFVTHAMHATAKASSSPKESSPLPLSPPSPSFPTPLPFSSPLWPFSDSSAPPNYHQILTRNRRRQPRNPLSQSPPPPILPPQPTTYDHYRVSLTWPFAFCRDPRTLCKTRSSDDFSLHGLWPAYQDGTSVTFGIDYCVYRSGRALAIGDANTVTASVPDLSTYWYSLKAEEHANLVFWNQEWFKHGYCATDRSMVEYFRFARNSRMSWGDITAKFRSQNIYPSSNQAYNLIEIEDAIRYSIGATNREHVLVKCSSDSISRRSNLESFEFCMDKGGTVISCPLSSSSTCGKKPIVMVPN